MENDSLTLARAERLEAHKKRLLVLREYLHGARYFQALKALEFAQRYHRGRYRKDNVTPEFDHQVCIALHALTLADLMNREAIIAAILLHDVPEDFYVGIMEIGAIFDDSGFRALVCNGVENVTKTFRGVPKPKALLYAAMAADPVAHIVKGCDRHHNYRTMIGVFDRPKQVEYTEETVEDIMPMLKKAKDLHPQHGMAIENLKHTLIVQMEMITAIYEAGEPQFAG